jgi:phytoene desaturase
MKAFVVGSGVGGLSSGIRLLKLGYEVQIFEKNAYTGGKVTAFEQEGYRFDAGPSLFTLPNLVDELFSLMGENPRDHFNYEKLPVVTEYFWDDGKQVTAYADKDKFADEVEKKLGEPKSSILKHLKHSAFLYKTTNHVFLEKSLHRLSTYLNWPTVQSILQLHRIDAMKTLHQANRKRFKSEKLVQMFNRYATYNGSNPYTAPGTLQVIPHLEFEGGAFVPRGGIHEISQSLAELFKKHGGRIHLNAPVEEILVEQNQVKGLKVNGQDRYADIVISNADVYPTYKNLLPNEKAPHKTLKQERSSSALIFYWGIGKEFPQLDTHNIFFSEDYRAEFKHLFEDLDFCEDLTIYINITSKTNPKDAPKGKENWFVMVNAPADHGQDWERLLSQARATIIEKLNRNLKIDLESLIETEAILTPVDIENKTSSFRGSLYGTSSNNPFAAFLRHPNFSQKIKGLYFTGGSVHPGGGIPLCLLSGKIVGDLIGSKIKANQSRI